MPQLIGITGTVGSGKSVVGKILAELGIPIIDTDAIVHDLLKNNGPVKEAIIRRFGKDITSADQGIDRKKLGKIVFDDSSARYDLEAIIHPNVAVVFERQVKQYAINNSCIAALIPLLFEAGWQNKFDEVWTVIAGENIIKERLKSRDQLSNSEIAKRMAAQMSQEQKSSKSHYVIDNSGTIEQTKHQIELLLNKNKAVNA